MGVACAGIVMCYEVTGNITKKVGKNRLYQILKRDGFGIYLAHPMIGYILFYLFQNVAINPLLFTCCVFLADIIGAVVITEILRCAKVRFAIGEYEIHKSYLK